MIKTHEINLSTSEYNTIKNAKSAIIKDDIEKNIEENDYVLFKQVETSNQEIKETGLYTFVRIQNVISNHPGLKDDYIMINYIEISY